MSFILIVKLALLAFTAFSAINYFVRRASNNADFKNFASEATTNRLLTPEEIDALTPFVSEGHLPIISQGVKNLHGEYNRHGIHVSGNGNSSSTMHNTIGGVDVLLPYDAINYIETMNSAEVVMTTKYAIVVKLNNQFDLVSARKRAAGHITEGDNPAQSDGQLGTKHAVEKPWFKVVSQREESELEMRAKPNKPNKLAGVAIAIGLCMLALSDGNWMFFTTGLALFIGGMFEWFFRVKPRLPKQVNRIQGVLMQVQHAAAKSHNSLIQVSTSIGGKQNVLIPHHWIPYIKMGEQVDVDVCVENDEVLRFGPIFSVNEEENLIPNVTCSRYIWLVLVSIFASFFLWMNQSHLSDDFAHANLFTRTKLGLARVLTNPKDANVGDFVQLTGSVHCDLVGSGGLGFSCDRLRLGKPSLTRINNREVSEPIADGAPLTEGSENETQTINKHLIELYNGNAILRPGTHSLAAVYNATRRETSANDPYGLYSLSQNNHIQMDDLVKQINAVCDDAKEKTLSNCGTLKEVILKTLKENDMPIISWVELDNMIRNNEISVLNLDASVKSDWENAIRTFAKTQINQLLDKKADALYHKQPAGVVYELPNQWAETALTSGALKISSQKSVETDATEQDDNTQVSANNYLNVHQDAVALYEALQNWGAQEMQVKVSGTVTGEKKINAHGDVVIQINPEFTPENALPAILRIIALIITVGLFVFSLAKAFINIKAIFRREKLLDDYWIERMRNIL